MNNDTINDLTDYVYNSFWIPVPIMSGTLLEYSDWLHIYLLYQADVPRRTPVQDDLPRLCLGKFGFV